jgi:hypothetical protein
MLITNNECNYSIMESQRSFNAEQVRVSMNKRLTNNPYRNMFKWINQEMKNLEAMRLCFENLQKVIQKVTEKRQIIVELKEDLETVEQGRTTMKRFW